MPKDDAIEVEGIVMDSNHDMFTVELPNGHKVIAHVSGKLRRFNIRVYAGDKVKVELSPYDLSRGRITWRDKN